MEKRKRKEWQMAIDKPAQDAIVIWRKFKNDGTSCEYTPPQPVYKQQTTPPAPPDAPGYVSMTR